MPLASFCTLLDVPPPFLFSFLLLSLSLPHVPLVPQTCRIPPAPPSTCKHKKKGQATERPELSMQSVLPALGYLSTTSLLAGPDCHSARRQVLTQATASSSEPRLTGMEEEEEEEVSGLKSSPSALGGAETDTVGSTLLLLPPPPPLLTPPAADELLPSSFSSAIFLSSTYVGISNSLCSL